MAISIDLGSIMKEKGWSVATLAKAVGITPANLSNIKNGNIRAIRFDTLDAICKALDCMPGDIIKYKEIKKVIPFFLDYSGTTDLLLRGGAENVKKFFDAIISLQQKTNSVVQITMVTGSSFETARSKHHLLKLLATNYGLENLFDGVVAEFCGYYIKEEGVRRLLGLDPRLIRKKEEIELLATEHGGRINYGITTEYDIEFDDISRANLSNFAEEVEKIVGDPEIETSVYYDEYGKECIVKPKIHSKTEAVKMLVGILKQEYSIPFIMIGGDSNTEDLDMYVDNKKLFKENNIPAVFVAPSNIGDVQKSDNNIIIGRWENSEGIVDAIQNLLSRINVREDGGIEYE